MARTKKDNEKKDQTVVQLPQEVVETDIQPVEGDNIKPFDDTQQPTVPMPEETEYIIKTPNQNFNGFRNFGHGGAVLFQNGIGKTTVLNKAVVAVRNWNYACDHPDVKAVIQNLK